MPIEPLSTRSPPLAFDRSIIEKDGDRRSGHANASSSSGLGSPESPFPIDIDGQAWDPESELGSAEHPILIQDPDALLQGDGTGFESASGPIAEVEPAFLRGLRMRTELQGGSHCGEDSPATRLLNLQDASGQDESAERAVAIEQSVVDPFPLTMGQPSRGSYLGSESSINKASVAHRALHSTGVTLTDEMDAPTDESGSIL